MEYIEYRYGTVRRGGIFVLFTKKKKRKGEETMKKTLAILLALIMMLAMVPAMAETDPTETINIPVTKIWNDEGNESNRPQSITVKLMKGTEQIGTGITLNAAGDWSGAFNNVPAYDNSGNPITYTVMEEPVSNYTAAYIQPQPEQVPVVTLGKKITPASSLAYTVTGNIIVAKKGSQYYVWTKDSLSDAQKSKVMAAVNAANLEGLGKDLATSNTDFKSGIPATFTTGQGDVTITKNNKDVTRITFGQQQVWSLFYEGTLTIKKATGATITNTYKQPEAETGSITVTKTVVMPEGDNRSVKNEEYTFTITQLGGTHTATNKVTIGDNNTGSVTFSNVPVGTYTVTETGAGMDGYSVATSSNQTENNVTVETNKTAAITFTNTYTKTEEPTGSLIISKTVTGLDNDSEKPDSFTFEIKQGETVKETVTVKKNANNTYDSVTIDTLPYGKYTVVERDAAVIKGYNWTKQSDKDNDTVEISKEAQTITFTNTYTLIPPNTGKLVVRKTVSGGGADYNKAFTFTVKLDKKVEVENTVSVMGVDSGNLTYDNKVTYGGVEFTNGVATFTLKHNQEKIIIGIPAGTKYTVTENSDGYTVTKSGDTGTIKAEETATAAFNNYKAGGGSSHHYYPNPTPIPPIIVNPPKTGDMTIWQSILSFFGII